MWKDRSKFRKFSRLLATFKFLYCCALCALPPPPSPTKKSKMSPVRLCLLYMRLRIAKEALHVRRHGPEFTVTIISFCINCRGFELQVYGSWGPQDACSDAGIVRISAAFYILQSLMILVYSSLLVQNATGAQKRWLLMSGAQLKVNLNIPSWRGTWAYFATWSEPHKQNFDASSE